MDPDGKWGGGGGGTARTQKLQEWGPMKDLGRTGTYGHCLAMRCHGGWPLNPHTSSCSDEVGLNIWVISVQIVQDRRTLSIKPILTFDKIKNKQTNQKAFLRLLGLLMPSSASMGDPSMITLWLNTFIWTQERAGIGPWTSTSKKKY